jgi:hypothetical protein
MSSERRLKLRGASKEKSSKDVEELAAHHVQLLMS